MRRVLVALFLFFAGACSLEKCNYVIVQTSNITANSIGAHMDFGVNIFLFLLDYLVSLPWFGVSCYFTVCILCCEFVLFDCIFGYLCG